MQEFDNFIPIDLFDIFNNKDLDSVVTALKLVVEKYKDRDVKFQTVKSEIGSGVFIYLAFSENENDQLNALEKRQSFYAAERKNMLDDNLSEWQNLKNQFSK